MKHQETSDNGNKDTLYLVGGIALMVFGAGLVLSHPAIRRYLGQVGVGDLVEAALPDVQRYLRIRAM